MGAARERSLATVEPMSDLFADLPPVSAAGLGAGRRTAFDEAEDDDGATSSDPFAGLSSHRDSDFHDEETPPDPFVGLGTPRGPAAVDDYSQATPAPTPNAEMLASAEAALGEHTVPAITIHAFWSRPETNELVQRAAADRRMERAKTVVQEGGLAGGVAYYQNQPTPSLIIVESLDPAQKLLSLLGQLAEVCDPGTKVIVVGAANDISLYRELMRRGVSEYLVPPLGPLQMIAAITALLYADPSQPFVGRQIAFCGAKGGAGSSTLAHNIAYLISEKMGANTVLVDLDLAFGTAGLNFNQDPLHGIADALSQPERLDPVLMERMMARCGDHLSLFAAPASIERDYDIPAETFDEVTQKIRASTPYVVLDLPHAWTTWKRRMLTTSDDVVVVTEPDLASLRNAKSIIDLVKGARPNDPPPRVILNKVGVPMRPEIPVKEFGEALGVQPALVIGFDAKLFGQAANSGQMIAEVGPKSKSADALDQLARMMINNWPRRREAGRRASVGLPARPVAEKVIQPGVRQARLRQARNARRGGAAPGRWRRAADRHASPTRRERYRRPWRWPPNPAPKLSTPGFEQLHTAQSAAADVSREQNEFYHQTKTTIFNALLNTIDLAQLAQLDQATAAEEIRDIVAELVAIKNVSMSVSETDHLVQDVINDVLGYGPLEPLLARDEIADIANTRQWRRTGCSSKSWQVKYAQLTNMRFRDRHAQLMNMICQRIVSQDRGRRVDEFFADLRRAPAPTGKPRRTSSPRCRSTVRRSPSRKFRKDKPDHGKNLVEYASISPEGARVQRASSALCRCNVVISGGTGSRANRQRCSTHLTAFIDPAEMACHHLRGRGGTARTPQRAAPWCVLETRPPNLGWRWPVITICVPTWCATACGDAPGTDHRRRGARSPKACSDLLQAMNTGHDGSMRHACTPTARGAKPSAVSWNP